MRVSTGWTRFLELIEQCRYGIHDISAVAIDSNTGLPRFNMPLELGLFLECNDSDSAAAQKSVLILDGRYDEY